MKFKDLKNKKHPFFLAVLLGENLHWISVFLRVILSFVLFPFSEMLRKNLYVIKHLDKFIKDGNYEVGYIYGLRDLDGCKDLKFDGVFGPANYTRWWSVFRKTCFCAFRIDRSEAFLTLVHFYEIGPERELGFVDSDACYELANLACKNGDFEAAWEWVEKAIFSDSSYGCPYHLRAWLGIKLVKGKIFDDLILAIENQPELEEPIFQDEIFKQSPELLESIKNALNEKKRQFRNVKFTEQV